MDLYLQPHGFLGTGASLLADLTLLGYIFLLIPAMLIGFSYARRGKHRPNHRNIMMSITVINWILIIFLMIVAYRFDVAENIAASPTNPRYLLPTIHGMLGLIAQLLATYVIYRMLREDYLVSRAMKRGEPNQARFWFRQAKPFMRVVLLLWLATALIGIFNYLFRYDVLRLPSATSQIAAPAATEAAAPVSTEEVGTPSETVEAPISTDEAATTTEDYSDDDYGFRESSNGDSLSAPSTENYSDDDYGFSDATAGNAEATDDHGGSGNSGRGVGGDD
jgi:uncharacterized membrane protein YozB (DUF420 family)